MRLYFDAAYPGKCCGKEPDGKLVRGLFPDDLNNGAITALPVTERLPRRREAVTRACRRRVICELSRRSIWLRPQILDSLKSGPMIGTCSRSI